MDSPVGRGWDGITGLGCDPPCVPEVRLQTQPEQERYLGMAGLALLYTSSHLIALMIVPQVLPGAILSSRLGSRESAC